MKLSIKPNQIVESAWLPLLLIVLGTLSIIFAWKIQNYDLGASTEDYSRLMRSQLVINVWEAKRDQWLIALNEELIKPKPDQHFLALAASETNKATLMWQGYLKLRIAKTMDEKQTILELRNHLIATNDDWLEKEDTKSLLQFLQQNVKLFKSLRALDSLDQQYSQRVDVINGEIQAATGRMFGFYAAGTIIALLGTTLSNLQTGRALNRISAAALTR